MEAVKAIGGPGVVGPPFHRTVTCCSEGLENIPAQSPSLVIRWQNLIDSLV